MTFTIANKKANKNRERQTRYLSQALQLEESVNPHIIVATMTMVSLSVLAFLFWAGFANISEVARTPGEVIPYGNQLTVQHLEGGIIKTIHVREGSLVQKGDPLITLDDAGIREDLERLQSKQLSLEMQAERLRAFIDGKEPDFSRFGKVDKNILQDQAAFFEGMRTAREKEEQIIRDQISQKEQSISTLEDSVKTAKNNLRITSDIYTRRSELNRNGYASDMQLLEDEKRLNDIKGQLSQLENQILTAQSEKAEFESRLESLGANQRDDAHEKLDQALAEKSQNEKLMNKLEERIGRLEIRAPAHGLVKGIVVNTIGSVIQPGQTIMEILPLDQKLEVQIRISPKDIGHVTPGQNVQVKFSTYDFSRYGFVRGTLDRISAGTFLDERGEPYYEGFVLLEENHVGPSPENRILPGMTVMADVVTGNKTILQYLLKPLQVSAQTAFTER